MSKDIKKEKEALRDYLVPPVMDYTLNGKQYRITSNSGPRNRDYARGFNSCRERILRRLNEI